MSEDNKEFVCRRCGEKLSTKQNLIRHINSKGKCEATLDSISKEDYLKTLLEKKVSENAVACRYCGTLFNHMNTVYVHHKTCKQNPSSSKYIGKNENNVVNLQQEIAILKAQLTEKTKENADLKTQNLELHSLIEQYKGQLTSITTNNGTINININNYNAQQMPVKNFGAETKDHISNEFILNCIMREAVGIRNMIEKIHFDSAVPENKNVRYKSTKRKIVEIVENSEWTPKFEAEILKRMIRNACNTMREYYNQDEELKERDDSVYESRIIKYLNEILEYKTKYKNTRDLVKALIEQHT